MKKIKLFFLWLLVISTSLFAQGTTGFEIARSEVGSRGAGMSGALIAVESGIDGLFYNPASLAGIENHRVDLTYFKHLLDIESGFVAYGQNYEGIGAFGIGINYINYGVFHEATSYGELTGETFRAVDFLATIGYGRKINDWIAVGANIKLMRAEIWDVSSSAFAGDAGILVYTPWDSTKIGAGVFNLGKTLDGFYDYKDELPLGIKAGISKPLAHLPLEWGLQVEKYIDSEVYLSVGGEFTLSEMFKLRFGWTSKGSEQRVGADSDILAGISGGLGFRAGGVVIDYSISSMGELGTLNRFSVGGEF
jgi:hypothetical protein